MRGLRAIRTALLAAAAGLMLALGAPAAWAGPGVLFFHEGGRDGDLLPGSEIRAHGNPTLTLRGLLEWQLGDVGAVRYVKIGTNEVVRPSRFDSWQLSDDPTGTRFVLHVRGTIRKRVQANTRGAPLEVFVHRGIDIAVKASARPKRVTVGKRITFSARVTDPDPPPGAQYSYTWDFGDGSTGSGRTVPHTYHAALSTTVVVVRVHDSSPDCAPACDGDARVVVQVGDRPKRRKAPEPTLGGATGSPGGAGSAAGTGGGGQGGSGHGSGSGTGTAQDGTPGRDPKSAGPAKAKPPRPAAKPFGTTISGVLVNDVGAAVRKLPSGSPAGAPKGPRAIRGGDRRRSLELALSGMLALGILSLGALRERRGVRLRLT